jgi:hypothetical protein
MLNRIRVCQLGVLIFARLAAGLCRQAQTRDDKAGAWTNHPIPITYILTTWHGMVNPVALSLCFFRLHLPLSLHQPSQR